MFSLLIFSLIGLMNDTIGEATMYLTTMDQQQLLAPKVLLASEKYQQIARSFVLILQKHIRK